MGLRDTFVKDIYCQKFDPEKMIREQMPRTCYTNQVHFVWNNYKRKMIFLLLIIMLKYIIMNIYNPLYKNHIYEKDKKYFKYNNETNKFDEIKFDSI